MQMATDATPTRYERLRVWMREHGITFTALGEQLGLRYSGARRVCIGTTCPSRHHSKMLELGFPAELLPEAKDMPVGPKPKVPDFPGLRIGNTLD
ncbi:MAG: XRE family transcriptional regulator [Deltaproteobacteria bacterium]|jgi:hypothetical protein|nr:XRE family transcriptional regulator [Deltaproteobacteria bacterium]